MIASSEPSILSHVQKRYAPGAYLKTDVEMKTWWSVREREDTKKGSLQVAPGEKFHVALGNDLFISNGKDFYHYNSASKQVQIKNLRDVDLSLHPSQVLTSFLTQYPLQETSRSDNQVILSWSSDSLPENSYKAVEATIDIDGSIIRQLKCTDRNNNILTYIFTKTEFGKKVPEKVFEFKTPTDARVVDER
jgi:outer membrane lipoprotein-sorting protein